MRTTVVMDDSLFKESKKILEELGLNFSDAVNLFAAMIVKYKSLPFEKDLKPEILKRIKEVENNQNIEEFSIEDIKNEIKKA